VGIRFNMSHRLFEKTEDGGSLVANRAQTHAMPERGVCFIIQLTFKDSCHVSRFFFLSLKNQLLTVLDIWGMRDKLAIEVMSRHNVIYTHDTES
jgi:hypothetical protein